MNERATVGGEGAGFAWAAALSLPFLAALLRAEPAAENDGATRRRLGRAALPT